MREVGGRHSTATHERARAKDASRRERASRREARRLALRWIREPSRRRDDVVGEGFRVRRERRRAAASRGSPSPWARGHAACAYEAARSFEARSQGAVAEASTPAPATPSPPNPPNRSSAPAASKKPAEQPAKAPAEQPAKAPAEPAKPPPVPVAKSDSELFYAQLLSQRRVFLNGRVDDKSAHSVIGKLLFLDAVDHEKPIILYINSGGGVVTSGLAIYDVMQHVRPPVYTVCLGHAESMAAVLLCAGERGHRHALPNARHDPPTASRHQRTDHRHHHQGVQGGAHARITQRHHTKTHGEGRRGGGGGVGARYVHDRRGGSRAWHRRQSGGERHGPRRTEGGEKKRE